MRPATFVSAALLGAALALPLAGAAQANIFISIDKTTQQMAVAVDGAQRYVWPVSTGRPGYETPNGTFKINRMDADHLSQEWDNAPMPHTMFFDLHGHAIHGFFDVKHLGLPVSHGCVRLAPDNAAILFDLVKNEGLAATTVVVSGQTPAGRGPAMARQPAPAPEPVAGDPMSLQPVYAQRPPPPYGQPVYGQPAYGQPVYGQPVYGQPVYGQRVYAQPQPYYGQRDDYAQPQPYPGQPQSSYAQPGYPAQPPPVYRQW